jgi:hypothetical protein
MEIITTADLTGYLGSTPTNAATLVELANGLVTDAWKDPVEPIPTWVRAIALEAAARPGRNPKGLASWTKSLDDASRTERLPEYAAKAGVFLTEDELTKLMGIKRRRKNRYGTIRVRIGT